MIQSMSSGASKRYKMLLASLGKEILPEILSQVIGNPNHSEKTLPPAYAKQGKTTDRVPTEGRRQLG